MRKIYQMRKEDLRWNIKEKDKKKIYDRCMSIIDDSNSSDRARGIAIKNILLMNSQNIQTTDDNCTNDNVINVNIIEKKDI